MLLQMDVGHTRSRSLEINETLGRKHFCSQMSKEKARELVQRRLKAWNLLVHSMARRCGMRRSNPWLQPCQRILLGGSSDHLWRPYSPRSGDDRAGKGPGGKLGERVKKS